MLETPTIVDAKGQPAAVIALRIPRAEIQKVMGPAIGEVMAAVSSQGIGPAGAVFSNHFEMSPDVFDFEVGVPVRSGVKPVPVAKLLCQPKIALGLFHVVAVETERR